MLSLRGDLVPSRFYVVGGDLPTFPNRLVFELTTEAREELFGELGACGEEWVTEELNTLRHGHVSIVVPFALRVQEAAYTSFHNRDELPDDAISLNLDSPRVFVRGEGYPTLCLGCTEQSKLKGRRCPNYVEGSLACVKTSRFVDDEMQAFSVNERGELVYNVAQRSDAGDESVEADSSTTAGTAE